MPLTLSMGFIVASHPHIVAPSCFRQRAVLGEACLSLCICVLELRHTPKSRSSPVLGNVLCEVKHAYRSVKVFYSCVTPPHRGPSCFRQRAVLGEACLSLCICVLELRHTPKSRSSPVLGNVLCEVKHASRSVKVF
jgi:hypothetical protein